MVPTDRWYHVGYHVAYRPILVFEGVLRVNVALRDSSPIWIVGGMSRSALPTPSFLNGLRGRIVVVRFPLRQLFVVVFIRLATTGPLGQMGIDASRPRDIPRVDRRTGMLRTG